MAEFRATYGVFDIDTTLTKPPDGSEYITVAYGTFPTMNAGGLGGGSVGNRRVSGTAACMVTDESTWTGLADEIWAFDVAHHEAGHATGGMPHQQNPRGIDAGDDGVLTVLQAFPGEGGGGMPSRDIFRERQLPGFHHPGRPHR